jgi:hypothetical protein
VDAFVVQHARADGERGGRAAGRRALGTGIDRVAVPICCVSAGAAATTAIASAKTMDFDILDARTIW